MLHVRDKLFESALAAGAHASLDPALQLVPLALGFVDTLQRALVTVLFLL